MRGAPPKKAEVEEAFGKLAGVKKVGELPTDDHAHQYELVSEQEVDLRPEVFQCAVEKGWVLLELHRDTQSLEDVFRNLTIGDERRNRHLSAAAGGARPSDDDDDEDGDDERLRRTPPRPWTARRRREGRERRPGSCIRTMKNILIIARRDLRAQFNSPVAYVVLGGSTLHCSASLIFWIPNLFGSFWELDRASMVPMCSPTCRG